MSRRPILLINGRWIRLDEIISLTTRIAADPTVPAQAKVVYARKGRPYMVYRVVGYVDTSTRRSGRQIISLANPEVDFA